MDNLERALNRKEEKNKAGLLKLKGQGPLYLQLQRILEDEIVSGKYSNRKKLPTEVELCQMYNVSRITVRQAISNLKNKGIIDSQQGKGTFVDIPDFLPQSNLHLFQSLEGLLYFSPRTVNKILRKGSIRTPNAIANLGNFKDYPKVYRLEGIRYLYGESLGYYNIYVLPEFGQLFSGETPLAILLVLEQKGGAHIREVHQTIKATKCNKRIANILKIKPGDPLMVFERLYFSSDNRLVQIGVSHLRADRYEYTIKLSRRDT
jgi:GntR family transcriptional regulator